MASRVTQAVRMMSTLHSNITSIRQDGALRRTIFSREHFPKFLIVVNVFSCYAGYSFMDRIQRNDDLRIQQSIQSEENLPKRYLFNGIIHLRLE